MVERVDDSKIGKRSGELEGLEALALGVEFARDYRDTHSHVAHENLRRWVQCNAGAISPFDLEHHNGVELAGLLVTLPEVPLYTELISNLILDHSPSAILALGEQVRNEKDTRALELLTVAASQEIKNHGCKTASRTLATLVFTQHIEPSLLPDRVEQSVTQLASGIHLLHRTQARSEKSFLKAGIDALKEMSKDSDAQRYITFTVRPEQSFDVKEQRNLAERVCDNEKELTTAVSAIYKILSDPKSSIEERIASYDKLLLVQDVILDRLRSPHIGDTLKVIFSTPGLMEELYTELGSIDLSSSNDIGTWLRAGLQNEYFRDDCLKALVHASVFGVDQSSLRHALFEAYKAEEVTLEEVVQLAERLCGRGAGEALYKELDLLETSIAAFGNSPLAFVPREKRVVDWVIKPSIDRIFDKAVSDLGSFLQASTCWPTIGNDAERYRERILAELIRIDSGEEIKKWGASNELATHTGEALSKCRHLYIQHELIRLAMPINRIGKGMNTSREAMAKLHVSASAIEQKVEVLVPSLFRLLATGTGTIYDQMVCDPRKVKDVVTHLASLQSNKEREPYFHPVRHGFVEISEGDFNGISFNIESPGKISIFDSGTVVPPITEISLSKDTSIGRISIDSSTYSTRLLDRHTNKIIPTHKSIDLRFYRIFADHSFDIHSFPQDTIKKGSIFYSEPPTSSFALLIGTEGYNGDLLMEVDLSDEPQLILHSQLSSLFGNYLYEQYKHANAYHLYADENFFQHMNISHVFEESTGERYIAFMMEGSDAHYLAPLRLFRARSANTGEFIKRS